MVEQGRRLKVGSVQKRFSKNYRQRVIQIHASALRALVQCFTNFVLYSIFVYLGTDAVHLFNVRKCQMTGLVG